jgi:hypothetical protein
MSFSPTYSPFGSHSTASTPETEARARRKDTLGEDAVPVPSHSRAQVPDDYRQVKGWGVDLDPANRPAVPRELPSEVKTVRGDVKPWQKPRTKIYISNEQPGITPVFGEACPSKGLSRLIRDYAYQYGEATNRHWMLLVMANRVDVLENMVLDALRGKPDHYIKEKGWGAKFKYEPNAGRNTALAGAAVIGAVALGVWLAKRR